jgi:hypothetical protein
MLRRLIYFSTAAVFIFSLMVGCTTERSHLKKTEIAKSQA